MVISVLSSVILIIVLSGNFSVTERCCCKKCCGFMKCLRKLGKKGSFWSMNFILLVTIVYYCYVIIIDGNKGMSILILFWFMATPFVAYRLNYLYPVPYPENLGINCCEIWGRVESFLSCRDQCCEQNRGDSTSNRHALCSKCCLLCSKCCVKCSGCCKLYPTSYKYCFVVYWCTLVMYFIESSYMFLAVTIDAAQKVTPLINGKFNDEAVDLNGLVVTLLGIRVAFNGRLLLFFWNKIFHGHKDLFSEPNRLLTQPVVRVMQCPQQPDDERRQPGPRQGPEE